MKRQNLIFIAAACILFLSGCCDSVFKVKITNPLDADRHPEMVELSIDDIDTALTLAEDETFIIKDKKGNEVPYQLTSDGILIFQVEMKAKEKNVYRIYKGHPSDYESLVYGNHYPDKDYDFAWENDEISYPRCYESYEILDKGPLRFRVKFTFRPLTCGNDKDIIETRVITLDAGSRLNHTSVYFANLDYSKEIVAGIVLREDGGEPVANAAKGYISYPAPTQNHDTRQDIDNGTIYVGHVYPSIVKEAKVAHGHV